MATFAILIWPIIALFVFAQRAIVPAVLVATVIPYLFLPEAFAISLPGIPDLDKTATIAVGLWGGLLFFGSRARRISNLPRLETAISVYPVLVFGLLATILIGTLLTVVNNSEPLFFGPRVIPAMRIWDVIATTSELVIALTPFFIARKYLATAGAHDAMLKIFVGTGLFYTILMLIEIRLSPQLHTWTYGYFQHSFLQHIRDGFRPIVFMEHGLWVGFFTFTAFISAVGLWKTEGDSKWLWAAIWLLGILLISKNLGAVLIGIMCVGIFLGLWEKMRIWAVVMIAVTILAFPALRQANLIPITPILEAAESVSEDRMRSLMFRVQNEDRLLDRAFEKPLTGWGAWGRDRIFNEDGRETSISEGYWILTLGAWGWIGYVGWFGLLTLPLISLIVTARRKEIPTQTMAIALICAGNLIYMIPNATLTPIGWLCFGALAGFAQYDKAKDREPRTVLGHTRFPHTTPPFRST